MNKQQLLNKINTELDANLEVQGSFYNGKCFIVLNGERIETSYKTLRGAKGYIKKNENNSYYCEYSLETVYPSANLEIIEVLESEIHDYKENKIIWSNELYYYFRKNMHIDNLKYTAERHLEGDILNFVMQGIEEIKNGSFTMIPEFRYYYHKNDINTSINNLNTCIEEESKKEQNEYIKERIQFCKEDILYYKEQLNKLENSIPEDAKKEINNTYFTLEVETIEEVKGEVKEVITVSKEVEIKEINNTTRLYFADKPDQETIAAIKKLGFRFYKNDGLYWGIYTSKLNKEELNNILNISKKIETIENIEVSEEVAKEITREQETEQETTLNITIEDLTSDISSYNIPQDIIKKENDNSFFRSKDINHNKNLHNTLIKACDEVWEVLQSNINSLDMNSLLNALDRFKRDYTNTTIKYLNHKGNNPSWMVTGRAGRNARQDEKKNNRQMALSLEISETVEKFNNYVNKAKKRIKNDIYQKEIQELEKGLDSVTSIPKFKRVKEEVKTSLGSYNKFKYVYKEFTILKDWGTWKVYNSKGIELYKSKTTGTLEECKKWVTWQLNKAETNIKNIEVKEVEPATEEVKEETKETIFKVIENTPEPTQDVTSAEKCNSLYLEAEALENRLKLVNSSKLKYKIQQQINSKMKSIASIITSDPILYNQFLQETKE